MPKVLTRAEREAHKKEANRKRRERNARLRQEADDARKLEIFVEVAATGGVVTDSGSKSPVTITKARDAMVKAFELLGGVEGLVAFGRKFPKEFYALWGKTLPRQSEVDVGENLEALLAELGGGRLPSIGQAAGKLVEHASVTLEPEDTVIWN